MVFPAFGVFPPDGHSGSLPVIVSVREAVQEAARPGVLL